MTATESPKGFWTPSKTGCICDPLRLYAGGNVLPIIYVTPNAGNANNVRNVNSDGNLNNNNAWNGNNGVRPDLVENVTE